MIERIRYMTSLYEEIEHILLYSDNVRDDLVKIKDKIEELEKYYTGPEWMEDFEADNEGLIPKDMNRGILTEDAIYDLLCSVDEIRK